MEYHSTAEVLERLEVRLTRIESRLVQLMIHVGLDPYEKKYEGAPAPPDKDTT